MRDVCVETMSTTYPKEEIMAKLGQQVKAQELAQQPQRATRVQRVKAQRDEANFVRLQAKAKQVQETQFKDKVVSHEETYYEYRPKKYSERDWNRLRQEQRDAILKPYRKGRGIDYYANRGDLVRTQQTRTVSETLPFTLDQGENSYENIYASLDKDLKPFFATPESLKQQRSTRIQTNLSNVNLKLDEARAKNAYLDQKYSQDRQALQDWWQNKSSSYRSNQRNRDNYNERRRDLEDDYEEDKQKQRGIIEGLEKGKGQLSQEKDIDINDIENYANDLANYYENREEARNDQKAFERKQVKDLEKRQAEAQAKGFNFTGTINESFVDPKTKIETKKGVKYYLGGAEVTPAQFSKQFDIYTKPSSGQFFVTKGTDISKLSTQQLETLFPVEFAQARQKSLTEQRLEANKISQLTLTPTSKAPEKTTLFSKIGSGALKAFGFAGDIVGSILPDVSGSGSRGLEQTTISEDELLTRRDKIKKGTFNIASLGLFSISGGGAVTGFGGKSPTIIEADIESFKLRRDIAKGSDETKSLQGVIGVQIDEITKAQTNLTKIDEKVSVLNTKISDGKPVSPEKATQIQKEYDQLKSQRFEVYKDLASKGVRTNINIDQTGSETISFTSPEFEKDFASAYVKEFRTKTPEQRKVAIIGSVGAEIAEGAILGLALGGSGALAKVGTGISKVPGLGTLITKFPTASKIGAETLFIGGTLAVSGLQSYRTGQEFKQQGLNATEGYLLGFGIPAGKAVGFYGGAKIGTKFYTQRVLEKAERGGFTRTVQKEVKLRGKTGKLSAEGRQVTEVQAGERKFSETAQASFKETRIPGTKIKISQEDYLFGRYKGREGFEAGEVFTKVTRGQTPIRTGSTGEARTFFIKPSGKEQTGIVAITKAKGGVNVDLFRTGVGKTKVNVLKEFSGGARLSTLEFPRGIEKVGGTVFVKGASLNDLTKVRKVLDLNRLFTSFAGEDRLFSVARTKQLVFETAPKATGYFDTTTGKAETVKQFVSIGSTKAGRVDAIKDILKGYGISTKEQSDVFRLLANKKGQASLFFKPSVTTTPTTISIDKLTSFQDASTLVLPEVVKSIAPIVTSDIALSSSLGATALSATGIRSRLVQQNRQNQLQNQIQQSLQVNIQQQQPQQRQQTQQRQQQTLQQQLQQQFQTIPLITPTPTPTPSGAGGFALLDFDLEFFDEVRKKAGKKRQKKDLAYVQDFTSKVVGFKPIEVSEREAVKLAQKVQTGFEIRAPIVVRKNNKDQRRLKKLLSQ